MERDRADQILREYDALRDPAGDPDLEAVKAAVFVEDVFGITLSDAEIELGLLGSPAAIRALLARRGDHA